MGFHAPTASQRTLRSVTTVVYDAAVVGSGPNGLSAAIALARQGRKVVVFEARDTPGGGVRTTEDWTLPGFRHDICSAIHPMGIGSPFWAELDLHAHGLRWIHPGAPMAHPFDEGPAALLEESLEDTAATLGLDEGRYPGPPTPFSWPDLECEGFAPAPRWPSPHFQIPEPRPGSLGWAHTRFFPWKWLPPLPSASC